MTVASRSPRLGRLSIRRSFLGAALGLVLLLPGLPVPAAAVVASALEGQLVSAVEVRSDAPLDRPQELMELIEVRAGEPFREEQVRRSLRNLQASGLAGQIEAWARNESEGIRVFLALYARVQVESVEFAGELCLRASELRTVVEQVPSTPLTESRIVRGVYRLEDRLTERGFLDARVSLSVDVDEIRKQAAVTYGVDCGEPTLISKVEVVGELGPIAAVDLLSQLNWKKGKRFERSRLDEDVQALQRWLFRSGYRLARVEAPRESSSAEERRVDLTYQVNVGPRFEIRVTGADQDLLRRKKLLELLEQERYDEALLLHVVDGIRQFFQERGHYDVEVSADGVERDGVFDVEIDVEAGPAYRIEELSFSGNTVITGDALRARIATGPGGVFGGGRLVDAQLEEDLRNLGAFYALNGFAEAKIGPAEIERVGDRLIVGVPVVEGPQQRVVATEFTGVEDFQMSFSDRQLAIRPGGPFHPLLVDQAVEEIRAEYEQAGYLDARVATEVSWDESSILAAVKFRILEGSRTVVGRVILRGNARTNTEVIRRAVGLEPGEPIYRQRLLDAQRRLYRLGVFSRVQVRLAATTPFARERDVIVRVEEGRTRRLTYGLGYDSDDGVRTLLGFSESNLFRRAVSGQIDLRVAQRRQQVRALVRQPFLGRWPVPMTYSLFGIEEEKESFDSRRRGLQVGAERLTGDARWGLLYTYKLVDIENPDPALVEFDIDRELRAIDISSLTPSFIIDKRDDPLVTTRGWTLNLQTEYAFPLLSADSEFVKAFGQHTHYINLRRLGVIAGSVRLGAIEALGSGLSADLRNLVPVSERFFAGGRTSHRAYRRDLLGVTGDTILVCTDSTCANSVPSGDAAAAFRRVPLGGNGLVLFNLDLRFPIVGPVGGTVFFDSGNVWGEWADVELIDLKNGAGIGVRYLSPIGPLRIEVGWKLDREPGESSAVVFLSFGNPF